ncbi:polysaccharide pyruvyl transferase family protein [Acuticoccus sediminis]|uniref:polysaccharide pyruvyl transferase family protein n=1 Tax=Acuticoccus sediminis TaxID=2184697 RepID=UPI001CFF34FD|nr:polysaccharide pyruvyl transferase family protein [Acuticoccus sediminis]
MARVALLSDTSGSLHPGSRLASTNIDRLFAEAGHTIAARTPFLRTPTKADEARFGDVDAIVLHGEGGIHHTDARPKVRRLLEAAVAMKAERGCPLILINATVAALDEASLRALAAFDLVVVRDGESADYLAPHIGRPRMVPDLSLAMPYEPPAGPRTGTLVIDSVEPAIDLRLAEIAAAEGLPLLRMDPRVLAGPLYRIRKLPFVRDRLARKSRPQDVLARVAAAERVLTGRFHGLMFSILARRPFRAIQSNTGKIRSAIVDALGSDERHITASEALSMDPAVLAAVPDFTATERTAIAAYLERAQTGAKAMMDDIAALVRR